MNKEQSKVAPTETQYEDRATPSRGRAIAVTLAAVWLQAIVIIYVVLQITRIATPFNQWFERIRNLLGL